MPLSQSQMIAAVADRAELIKADAATRTSGASYRGITLRSATHGYDARRTASTGAALWNLNWHVS